MGEVILAGIALVGAIIGPYVGFRVSEAVNKRRWIEMDEIVRRFQKNHETHFDHAKMANADMARAQQQIEDHDKRDNEWFLRIEAMLREIRDNLRHK